ncbi:penicillin acylase family protein [Granulicella rosea]|nr:penicillin acylase family protein [Granulicella rosea]
MLPFVRSLFAFAALVPACVFAQTTPEFKSDSQTIELAKQALPFHRGQLTAVGLHHPVTVIRDKWGIAHIYAGDTHDLFFAQGFAAAQDHMWQMEMWRRSVEGRLAEVLGPDYVNRDRFARTLTFHGDWDAEERKYSPEGPVIFASFAEGVNAAIRVAIDQGKIPIEFQMMGTLPVASWTAHTLLTRVPAWGLSRNAASELARALAIKTMGPEKADQLIVTEPAHRFTVPEGLDLADISPLGLALARDAGNNAYKIKPLKVGPATASVEMPELPAPTKITDPGVSLAELLLQEVYDDSKTYDLGSNNWVAGGQKTVTGKPILANDPHREIQNPGLRNFVHLVSPGYDVIGMTEPGLPGVSVGHNENVAWGFTILGTDQEDLYIETTDPANPNRYLYKGQWLEMETSPQAIQVKKGKPVMFSVKWTMHGPVVYEDATRHIAYALKWVGAEAGGAGYLGSLNVLAAKDWKEFTAGVAKSWYLPSHSLVYADTAGNYGYLAAVYSPVRLNWDGLLPVPGKDGKFEWAGFTPLDKLPRELNGARGFYATANNDVLPKLFPHNAPDSGYEYSADFRFRRIEEVLSQKKKFSIADFEALQFDNTSLPARRLIPLLKNLKSDKPAVADALKQLNAWNMVLDRETVAGTIYEYWLMKLTSRVYALYVPADQQKSFTRYDVRRVIEWVNKPDAAFGANPVEARNKMLLDSLDDAIAMLTKLHGADESAWKLGKVHKATFEHPLLSPETKELLEVEAVERGGDAYTVKASSSPTEKSFEVEHGASAMMILDTSNWDNSVALNTPGNESAAGSPHSKDLAPMWQEGKYFPLAFSRAKVEGVAETTQMLEPLREAEGDAGKVPFVRAQTELFADTSPVVVSWADYDNDGWPDLFIAYTTGVVKLFHNDHGTLRDVTAETHLNDYPHRISAASWGDFDGDGNLDLYLGYAYAPAVPNRLLKGDGHGHFVEVGDRMGIHDTGETRQVSFVDYNNDGKPDLWVAFRDRPNRLYRNDGDHFTEVAEKMGITGLNWTVGSLWFDYNGDGKLDLFEANQNGKLNKVYRNDGDHFTEVAHELGLDGSPRSFELGSVNIAAADFNNDGNIDLFYANYGPSWLLRNDGGKFTDVAPAYGAAINAHVVCAGWGDYDNDGLPDLYTDGYLTGHEHQEDYLFHNEGDHFADVTPGMMLKHDGDHALVWVDYNKDGAVDLSIADHEGEGVFSLYRNTLPAAQAHQSLEVLVVDAKGHATKAGSEVRLYKAGTRTVLGGRLVDTGSGYNSQSVIPVHFGLGAYMGPVDVEVTFMTNGGRKVVRVPGVAPAEHIGDPLIVKAGE